MRPPISAPMPAQIALELIAPSNETKSSPNPNCFAHSGNDTAPGDDRARVDVVRHRRQAVLRHCSLETPDAIAPKTPGYPTEPAHNRPSSTVARPGH